MRTRYFTTFVAVKRKVIYIGIVALLVGLMSSCGGSKRQATNSGKERVAVSIAPLRPLVGAITGDDFDIDILVPTGASPESFEPTPRQFIELNEAQMLFTVGLIDFERSLLAKLREQSKVVSLAHGIDLIAGSCSHNHNGAQADHTHCYAHGIDPHIWTSPVALKRMAQNAYEAIVAEYPDSVKYQRNYEQLLSRLDLLDGQVRRLCDSARVRKFIIYHPALTYLARDYSLEQVAIEHEGKEPSVRRLAEIIDNARREGVKRIFYQSTYPRSVVEIVADDIGGEAVEIDPLREDVFVNIEEMTRLITE